MADSPVAGPASFSPAACVMCGAERKTTAYSLTVLSTMSSAARISQ